MYCKHCGSEMPDDAIFCSHCGTRLEQDAPVTFEAAGSEAAPAEPAGIAAQNVQEEPPITFAQAAPAAPVAAFAAKTAAPEAPRKPFMEEMQWNVSEYPDSNVIEKTEDIDFNWNTDPETVPDAIPRSARVQAQKQETAPQEAPTKSAEGIRVSEIFDRVVPAQEVKAAVSEVAASEAATAAPKEEAESLDLGKFNTITRKNAAFQELLNKEYEKILDAGTIGSEQSQADAIAKEKFDSRQETMTMDQFLEQEGAVKLYEPKPLESDVLARIEAQEKKRARQKAEEEARAKALEEARAAAQAQKQAEVARLNSEAEASAAAAEEIRLAEEEQIRQRTEEEARRKAARQAAQLEAIAARQAAQEQAALQEAENAAAEEARQKAEEEARALEAAKARAAEEAEAARAAEEEARRKAEAELNAAREAARIRARQEANLAAQEEARFRAEQERRHHEAEILRQKQALQARQQERHEGTAAVEAQVKDALAQTARMREEEEAKIKAALAGIRSGRFSDTISAGEAKPEEKPEQPVEIPQASEVAEPTRTFEIPRFGETVSEPVIRETEAAAAAQTTDVPQTPAVATAPEQIEEAHQATRDQIDEMAKARETFFADFPDADQIAAQSQTTPDLSQTRMVSKDTLMAEIESTKKMSREALHLEQAPADPFAQVTGLPPEFTAPAEPEAPAAEAVPTEADVTAFAQPAEAAGQPLQPEETVPAADDIAQQRNDIDDLLSQFASVSGQSTPAAEEPPYAQPELQAQPEGQAQPEAPAFAEGQDAQAEPLQEEQPAPIRFSDDTLNFFSRSMNEAEQSQPEVQETAVQETALPQEDILQPAQEVPFAEAPAQEAPAQPAAPEMTAEDFFAQTRKAAEAPAFGEEAAGEKPGLEDTMVMPMGKDQIREAAQTAEEDMAGLSAKERKKAEKARAKEAKRAAKAAAAADIIDVDVDYDEAPKKGGVGRTILMIILILLCLIFALELAGIGIKLLAPTSGAAEFIDNILNNLIHTITG